MKILRIILIFLNVLAATALLLSYAASYISPEKIAHLAYFGFAYPALLIINLIFILFWVFSRLKYALISLITILLGFGILSKHVQIFGKSLPDEKANSYIHLISYNVQLFGLYNWTQNQEIRDSIINFIQSEQPDILCLQEYYTNQSGRFKTGSLITEALEDVNMHESFSVHMHGYQSYGMASFIRYPICHTGEIQFENSNNLVQFTDFIFQKDTLRLYNIHLQSLHFDNTDYQNLDNLQVKTINKKELGKIRNIMHKFVYAAKKRVIQSDSIKYHINQSPYPVIVCGDFNDTPGSYTYNLISKDLKDAFQKSGKGLDLSYQRGILRMRIDHILHDKSLKSYGFETKNIKYSDHFPVSCYLSAK
ncbi:MAG: endonuclease/exonuclease/phosphatase family protein [Bacteroidota bacterium]|nr:endonuclease/exonuclease/phosphatase family protein [Bacteroidota bacterium]